MYLKGEGVEQDYRCSSNVFSLAAKTVIRMLTTTLAINFIMALVLLKIMKKHLTIT